MEAGEVVAISKIEPNLMVFGDSFLSTRLSFFSTQIEPHQFSAYLLLKIENPQRKI
jgi:hypothetical protein